MPDKYISVQAMRKRLGIDPEGDCNKCQYGGGIGACMKPVYVEYICGELDKEPAADVVARDCFNRILAENDTMREQLASIGKKPGDKMDDVRRVVRGEWVPYPVLDDMYHAFYKCSVCGEVSSVPHGQNIKERKPFCECGARMKVEDNT